MKKTTKLPAIYPDLETAMLVAELLQVESGLPYRAFECPHCGYIQVRKFPRSSGNYCNDCQEEMD